MTASSPHPAQPSRDRREVWQSQASPSFGSRLPFIPSNSRRRRRRRRLMGQLRCDMARLRSSPYLPIQDTHLPKTPRSERTVPHPYPCINRDRKRPCPLLTLSLRNRYLTRHLSHSNSSPSTTRCPVRSTVKPTRKSHLTIRIRATHHIPASIHPARPCHRSQNGRSMRSPFNRTPTSKPTTLSHIKPSSLLHPPTTILQPAPKHHSTGPQCRRRPSLHRPSCQILNNRRTSCRSRVPQHHSQLDKGIPWLKSRTAWSTITTLHRCLLEMGTRPEAKLQVNRVLSLAWVG